MAVGTILYNGLEDCELISIPKVLKGSVDFICGIISSLLYLVVDITASVYWNEFYNIIVFGLCTFMAAEKKLSLRITGLLLIGYAIIGIVTPTFFPAPMRNVEATVTNTMHLPRGRLYDIK